MGFNLSKADTFLRHDVRGWNDALTQNKENAHAHNDAVAAAASDGGGDGGGDGGMQLP